MLVYGCSSGRAGYVGRDPHNNNASYALTPSRARTAGTYHDGIVQEPEPDEGDGRGEEHHPQRRSAGRFLVLVLPEALVRQQRRLELRSAAPTSGRDRELSPNCVSHGGPVAMRVRECMARPVAHWDLPACGYICELAACKHLQQHACATLGRVQVCPSPCPTRAYRVRTPGVSRSLSCALNSSSKYFSSRWWASVCWASAAARMARCAGVSLAARACAVACGFWSNISGEITVCLSPVLKHRKANAPSIPRPEQEAPSEASAEALASCRNGPRHLACLMPRASMVLSVERW